MIRKWLAVLWLAIASTSAAAADRIERVEPASWWVGMKDDRLQLLVHGDRVAELQPKLSYPGVTLVSAERVENPNYVFVNLRIAPGRSRTVIERAGDPAGHVPYRLPQGALEGGEPQLCAECPRTRIGRPRQLRTAGHDLPDHA